MLDVIGIEVKVISWYKVERGKVTMTDKGKWASCNLSKGKPELIHTKSAIARDN